jgi:heptosyltransferase-2
MNVLVIRLGALGDVLLATPVFAALRRTFPGARIDLCTDARLAPLFEGHPSLRQVIPFDHALSTWQQGRALRESRYDVVVDLHHKPRTALLARLASAPRLVSFVKRRGKDLWRAMLGRPLRPGLHTADAYVRALAPIGVPPLESIERRLEIRVDPNALERVDAWLHEARLGATIVGLAPGAKHATKKWPVASFIALANEVRSRGLGVPLGVGGPHDARELDALAIAGIPCAPAAWPLVDLAALLSRLAVLVVGDSGPQHLAAAVGTAVISLFGPTDPVRWSPLGVPHRVLRLELPCSPCSNYGGPSCPVGTHACLRDLAPHDVVVALNALLRERAGAA